MPTAYSRDTTTRSGAAAPLLTTFSRGESVVRLAVRYLLLAILVGCAGQLDVTERGKIAISVVRSVSSASVQRWHVTINGPSGVQGRDGTPGETLVFDGLLPGSYSVVLEGYDGNDLVERGSTSVGVQAGATSPAPISTSPVVALVSVAADDPISSEAGPDSGRFTFSRTGSTAAPLVLTVAFSGSATSGTDYRALATQIVIPAAAQSVSLFATPFLDAVVEDPPETIVATVVDGAAYDLGASSTASVTITDAPVITVTSTDLNASEVGPDKATVQIVRTGTLSQPLSVNFSVTGSAASGTDYEPLSSPVTIPAGQSSVSVEVVPKGDAEVEPAETVVFTLVASPSTYAIGNSGSATITIADAPVPLVSIAAVASNATETLTNTGRLRLTRTGSTANALTVSFTISGTAINGVDYDQIPSTAIFASGAATTDISIAPKFDAVDEGPETAIITLIDGASYDLGATSSATVTISDAPIVSITATDATASEQGNDTGRFQITLSRAAATSLSIRVSVSGTATAGADYVTFPVAVAIPAGQLSANVDVQPIIDAVVEGNETVIVTLAPDSTSYAVGGSPAATVVISDTPPPTVAISTVDGSASEEGPTTGTLRISRSGVPSSALAVNIAISGSATNGVDYRSIASAVTIPSGASSTDITVEPFGDALAEGDETVVVTLANGSGYTIGSPTIGVVTIVDLPVPSSITISPRVDTVAIQGTHTLSASVRDQAGSTVPGAVVSWQSLDPGIATVSSLGVVTGVSVGSARIKASTPGAGRTLADTVRVDVINTCLFLRPLTLGTTYNGRIDSNTCHPYQNFAQVDQFSVTSSSQAYYSVRLTPTFSASLVQLNVGASVLGLGPNANVQTALVVKRAGTFGMIVGTPVTASGTYTLTTALNPDPFQSCDITSITRQVSFETALTPVCRQRDFWILPAITGGSSITISATAQSFQMSMDLRDQAGNVLTGIAFAPAAGLPATITYSATSFHELIIRIYGPQSVNERITITIN